jgi:hypothetical protein
MRDTDDIGFACVHSPVVMTFHYNAKGGEPIEPEELGEWGVPRSGMIGRSREREGGPRRAAASGGGKPNDGKPTVQRLRRAEHRAAKRMGDHDVVADFDNEQSGPLKDS